LIDFLHHFYSFTQLSIPHPVPSHPFFHIPNRNVPGASDSESSSSNFSLGAFHKLGPFAEYLQTPHRLFGPLCKAGDLAVCLSLKERNIARK
jgi:hypothetical protein